MIVKDSKMSLGVLLVPVVYVDCRAGQVVGRNESFVVMTEIRIE